MTSSEISAMPLRILSSTVSLVFEYMLIGMVAAYHAALAITEVITEKDWARLLGEDGFKAALLIGLVVVWGTSEKSKNQRHKELVEALAARDIEDKRRIDQFIDLSAETIKAQAKVTLAISAFDANCQRVYLKLDELTEKIVKPSPVPSSVTPPPHQPKRHENENENYYGTYHSYSHHH
jgi:hypothetical protein